MAAPPGKGGVAMCFIIADLNEVSTQKKGKFFPLQEDLILVVEFVVQSLR